MLLSARRKDMFRFGMLLVRTTVFSSALFFSLATKKIQTIEGHQMRVGALAWNGEQLSSGSRDRTILQRDIRCPSTSERKLQGHRQEICGLKWSPDGQFLASGGNDNKLLVWNKHGATSPMQTYSDHIAAVKAIAWSPHQHGLLASGGGTADRCIKFWNTLTQTPLQRYVISCR